MKVGSMINDYSGYSASTAFVFAPLPPLRASFLCGNQHQPPIRILPLHVQLTHLPKLNFAPRPPRLDHSPQTSTMNRGIRTTRVCPIESV
jgi:hypothetical protein